MDFEDFLGTPECKIGNVVWVCDYRYNDLSFSKALRHVPPTEVEIHSNEDIPPNKRVYYSDIHFRPKGKKAIIAPFDNTGFRSFTGTSIQVFLKEVDARKYFKETCLKLIEDLKAEKIKVALQFDCKIDGIRREIEEL